MTGVPGLAIPNVPGDTNGVNENARPKFGYGMGRKQKEKTMIFFSLSPFGGKYPLYRAIWKNFTGGDF